jgi:hypothetical protein
MVINLTINVQPCFENTLLCYKAREMNMHAHETPIIQIKGPFSIVMPTLIHGT